MTLYMGSRKHPELTLTHAGLEVSSNRLRSQRRWSYKFACPSELLP